jgi:hypothetical protein
MRANTRAKWRNILVLSNEGDAIKTYRLDAEGRHVCHLRRQRKRNLHRLTGSVLFSDSSSDDQSPEALMAAVSCKESMPHMNAPPTVTDDVPDLMSVAWLLNEPTRPASLDGP